MRIPSERLRLLILVCVLLAAVSAVQASTTLYLRNTAATDPRPTAEQSSDTILHDAATSRATYANPADMLITPGTASQTNQGSFGGTGANHKTHYGSFISPPLYAQTISGTVSLGLVMREYNDASNNFPRIYIYVWKADNTGRRCDLVPLTTSTTEVSTAYPGNPTLYFSDVAVDTCTLSEGDRIVLEVETDDNPTRTNSYTHGLRFGGAAGGGYGSYLSFSQDLFWTITPGFKANRTSGACDLAVLFTDTSSNNPTSWYWDFGDGENSTLQNPVHIYRQAGSFDVGLKACNAGGCSWKNSTSFIRTTMVAGFGAAPTSGKADLPVAFTDTSKGTPTSWFWDFGDGENSILQNPVHIYRQAGTFTVRFQACNGGVCGWKNSSSLVKITMNTSFTADLTSGNANLPVTFNDTSLGTPTSWSWTFGDGASSTLQNVTHTYVQAGSYQVTLKACRGSTCTTLAKTAYINVSTCASFTSDVTSGPYPLTVHFYDISLGNPSSRLWLFGDGTTSTTRNATHTYSRAGVYEVDFRACRGTFCSWSNQTAYITVAMSAAFTANQTQGSGYLPVQFTDQTPGTPDTWFWDFGDGSTSDLRNPVHGYTLAGIYDVSFRACQNQACSWMNRTAYINLTMDTRFAADSVSGDADLTVRFTDLSGGSPDSWVWDFGDGDTSAEQNPSHTYVRAGVYDVGLNACRGTTCAWSNTSSFIEVRTRASFDADRTSGDANLTVRFTDESRGLPESWLWDFGDGESSDLQNPVHIYTEAGIYDLCFRACRGPDCAWENRSGYISVGVNTSFTSDVFSGEVPLSVQFEDTSEGAPGAWYWEFGDGSSDTGAHPSHVYWEAGKYDVGLRACRGAVCGWENRTAYIVATRPPSPPQPSIRIGGGGSGSHGGSSVLLTTPPPGGPYTVSFDDTTPVSQITLVFQGPVDHLIVNVNPVDSLPPQVSPPSGMVFGYFGIELSGGQAPSSAQIDFTVPTSWLEERGFSPGDIILMEYQASRWVHLPTQVVSSSGEEACLQATTPEISSYFAVTGPSTAPGGVETGTGGEGPTSWLMENSFPVSILGAAMLLLTFLAVARYLRRQREDLPTGGRPEDWGELDGLLEGEKEKAYSAIIDVLNSIDTQLNDLDITFALRGPGYAFPQRNAKAVVDRFFFSCQVAERRIKVAAASGHITGEQVAYLNEQLEQAVQRMVDTSRQSDILTQLVEHSLGARAAV